MSIYRIHKTQHLPITIKEAWDFFSNPNNLKKITPPELGLEVRSETGDRIYDGMIIIYSVNPLPYYKTEWVTEIKHVRGPYRFVDEQVIGPYKFWHHQHSFSESDNGTLVEDLIHYSVPYGYLGRLLNKLYVVRSLDRIFEYRSDVLNRIFSGKVK